MAGDGAAWYAGVMHDDRLDLRPPRWRLSLTRVFGALDSLRRV